MILPVVKYGEPVLRQKGAKIEQITPEIQKLIQDMMDTMYDSNGIGLAAQQVGKALQLTVLDLRGVEGRPSTLEIDGKEADVNSIMPLVLINPAIIPVKSPVEGPEGCLSFPEIYGNVLRPESVEVTAMNEKWEPVKFRCGGLLARAVQHEFDHLQGILFIDRMTDKSRQEVDDEVQTLLAATKERLKRKR